MKSFKQIAKQLRELIDDEEALKLLKILTKKGVAAFKKKGKKPFKTPLTCYQLFSRDNREKTKERIEGDKKLMRKLTKQHEVETKEYEEQKKTNPKVRKNRSIKQLVNNMVTKELGEKWAAFKNSKSEKDKKLMAKYEKEREELKAKYEKNMAEYNPSSDESSEEAPKKSKKGKTKRKRKKGISGWILFQKMVRDAIECDDEEKQKELRAEIRSTWKDAKDDDIMFEEEYDGIEISKRFRLTKKEINERAKKETEKMRKEDEKEDPQEDEDSQEDEDTQEDEKLQEDDAMQVDDDDSSTEEYGDDDDTEE